MNNQSKSNVATIFKRGDRVRLKAWVTKPKIEGSEKSFPPGCVGIISGTPHKLYGIPYRDIQTPLSEKRWGRAFVAEEDLELMPERQVHIVKDGKVYELRNTDKYSGNLSCRSCDNGDTCNYAKSSHYKNGLCKIHQNFQEVKSGKVVS